MYLEYIQRSVNQVDNYYPQDTSTSVPTGSYIRQVATCLDHLTTLDQQLVHTEPPKPLTSAVGRSASRWADDFVVVVVVVGDDPKPSARKRLKTPPPKAKKKSPEGERKGKESLSKSHRKFIENSSKKSKARCTRPLSFPVPVASRPSHPEFRWWLRFALGGERIIVSTSIATREPFPSPLLRSEDFFRLLQLPPYRTLPYLLLVPYHSTS